MGAGGWRSWKHPGCAEQHQGGEPGGVEDARYPPGPGPGAVMCV